MILRKDILLVDTLSLLVVALGEQLAFCDVQRYSPLWKTFRGIVITVPGITINSESMIIFRRNTDHVHPGIAITIARNR